MKKKSNFPKSIIVTDSEIMTERAGFLFAENLETGALVGLYGEFGSGKTVFTRGIARYLGIEGPITSPSFTIVQEYDGDNIRLYHIDLYRINDEESALNFGIEDVLQSNDSITVIEWADRIPSLIGSSFINVFITSYGINQRIIKIE